MKYVVLQTADGAKHPIVFPECLTHIMMAALGQVGLERDTKRPRAKAVSAGFIAIEACATFGESESLGGMKSLPEDAVRIMFGQACAFMPDEQLADLFNKYKEHTSDERG